MNIKKILLAGTVAGVCSNLWGLFTCQWLFKWVYFIEPIGVYQKAMLNSEFPWLFSIGVGKIILAVILAFGYAIISKSLPGKTITKGLLFGVLIYFIGVLPIRFSDYMSLNLSAAIRIYWLVNDLLSFIISAIAISLIYKE